MGRSECPQWVESGRWTINANLLLRGQGGHVCWNPLFCDRLRIAFAMGVVRTVIVAPRLGATAAVLIELPIVLLASWGVIRGLLRRRPFTLPQRVAIGTTAFTLTMVSEAVFAGLLRGQSVTQWVMEVATALGLVGLAGQVGFAAMPIFVGRGSRVVVNSS